MSEFLLVKASHIVAIPEATREMELGFLIGSIIYALQVISNIFFTPRIDSLALSIA
jgi:hypothetical protein